jgi:uncharacterized membrane protein
MDPTALEWLHLVLRWVHVFVGILWIGQTYFFTWLDGRLRDAAENPDGQVWMVHSGGFYVVDRRAAPQAGHMLHWFRWEAALTWATGLSLLLLVYYFGGLLVDDRVQHLTSGVALAVGLGGLGAGWLLYELLFSSPLSQRPLWAGALSLAAVCAAAWGLLHVFSARAAYIHIGALFGTIMAANVWLRILPAQRRMIAATSAGRPADAALAARAKLRSKHNTYLVVPLIFIMISNHFPSATYGHEQSFFILCGLIIAGGVAAKFIYRH